MRPGRLLVPVRSSATAAASLALGAAAVIWASSVPGLDAQASARERTLFVSAVDDAGEPVAGLGPEAFIVREDGIRREILRVSRATEPIDIALLVDNSAAASDDILFLREALATFVARMAPGNQIAVITLADRPTIAADYTGDAGRLGEAVGRLFAMSQSGMTLLDAIWEVSRGLARRETPRAVIVAVFTDGPEFTNRYHRDVAAAAREAGAALHLVTLGQFLHSEEHGIRERSFLLDSGPSETGGQRISLLSPNGLEPALERLARELTSQYKVVYGRPESFIPPERIEVASARAGVKMRGAPARGEGRRGGGLVVP
ncbi:MAG TPA: VWA domain-containing protein [Vicinamibacterales bacterium]|nr:VWA domain-containing protein [Vicinamibacterales bacterium]